MSNYCCAKGAHTHAQAQTHNPNWSTNQNHWSLSGWQVMFYNHKILLKMNMMHAFRTTVPVTAHCGPKKSLLEIVKRQKFTWFRHVMRHDSDSLSKTILKKAPWSWRACDAMIGRGNAGWITSEWTSLPTSELLTMASHRKLEKDLCWIVPHVPLIT